MKCEERAHYEISGKNIRKILAFIPAGKPKTRVTVYYASNSAIK